MERNISLEIVDDIIRESNDESYEFIIDDDKKAEWALRKIAEEKAETQRYVNVCRSIILEYEEKIRIEEEKMRKKLSYLESQLQQYFQSVTHKTTKTQETYKLPSGTLRLKYQQSEFKRDEGKLISWLKENELTDFIKIEEKPNWAELKKRIQVSGDKAVSEDGQIIDGIEVIEKPPVFEIDI